MIGSFKPLSIKKEKIRQLKGFIRKESNNLRAVLSQAGLDDYEEMLFAEINREPKIITGVVAEIKETIDALELPESPELKKTILDSMIETEEDEERRDVMEMLRLEI
ncbi:hypothetical protein COB57_03285 [Candidatus Peregrinibacteria bacterium]|nr:MAG: hypothetical protein COB57_03285 [Candidatus Peregrinibacteria bacterium]